MQPAAMESDHWCALKLKLQANMFRERENRAEDLLQTGLPLFQPVWASLVQSRHWTRHTGNASFIPHAWVDNTCRTGADTCTLPCQSALVLKTNCKQVMSFAQSLKSVATPVKIFASFKPLQAAYESSSLAHGSLS